MSSTSGAAWGVTCTCVAGKGEARACALWWGRSLPLWWGRLLPLAHLFSGLRMRSPPFTNCSRGSAPCKPAALTKLGLIAAPHSRPFLLTHTSNMVFSSESAFPPGPALAAQSYPFIKLFSVVSGSAVTPQDDLPPQTPKSSCTWSHDPANASYVCNAWVASTRETNGKFSAVCLFTALAIARNHTGTRPIGLIQSAVGGSSIELWAPPAAYAGCPIANASTGALSAAPAAAVNDADTVPGVLYNAMIAPLAHYSMRSVLWLQGEEDGPTEAARPGWYSCRFERLIKAWRAAWGMGDVAFNYVQLGAVGPDSPATAQGVLRIAQNAVLPRPNGSTDITGCAAAYDLGDASSPFGPVHFRSKVTVGDRLAAAVLHSAFALQYPTINWAPPVVTAVTPASAPPFSTLTLSLAVEDGSGAALVDGGQCTACCAHGAAALVELWSAAAGAWRNASALTLAADGLSLHVTAPAADAYTLLRFAAQDYPQCAVVGLGNGVPLPAQLLPVGAPAELPVEGAAEAPPAGVLPAEAPFALPLALPSAGAVEWRGQVFPWSAADPPPPMGLNTWCVGGLGVMLARAEIATLYVFCHFHTSHPSRPPRNAYHTNVDEVLVQDVGRAFATLGLRTAGWRFVNVDDGWQVARNASGFIIPDPTR